MILIAPYSKPLRDKNLTNHPKNYPFWDEIIKDLLSFYDIIQLNYLNREEPLSSIKQFRYEFLKDLNPLLFKCKIWISVDNFFHHYAALKNKSGIVIFSQSDPNIFGHKQNINLLKDRKYLKENQFDIWERVDYNIEAFIDPKIVIGEVHGFK